MGFYESRILPRIFDKTCGSRALDDLRRRTCAGLSGEVVEIGFGSGLNVPFYPGAVTGVAAVDPSGLGWQLAARRVAGSPIPIERSGMDGQALPFPDASADAVLSTLTMCSIPDLPAALAEIRRVLKPGGTLHFLEHGQAPDPEVLRWQRRLEPMQKRFFGGCHLTRRIDTLVRKAGFEVRSLDTFYAGRPKSMGAAYLGVAAISR